jgi:hypothetical protein
MANLIIEIKAGFYHVNDGSKSFYVDQSRLDIQDLGTGIRIAMDPIHLGNQTYDRAYNEIVNADNEPYGTELHDILMRLGKSTDVNLQDQHTPAIIAPFNQIQQSTTLSVGASIGDRNITLTSVTGIVDGSYLVLFNPTAIRFSQFYVIGSPSGNIVTLDTPLDFAYPTGTYCDIGITNMNVNGSVTPQVFGLRGTGTPPGVHLTFDVTRIMFEIFSDTAVDLSKFGDLTRLANGLVMRKRDGAYNNIFNVKSNGEIAVMAYDWDPYVSTNPTQGQDGFTSRLTFGGQNKIGVVQRLEIGEDLEIIIQDDLRLLDRFIILAEGHIVEY